MLICGKRVTCLMRYERERVDHLDIACRITAEKRCYWMYRGHLREAQRDWFKHISRFARMPPVLMLAEKYKRGGQNTASLSHRLLRFHRIWKTHVQATKRAAIVKFRGDCLALTYQCHSLYRLHIGFRFFAFNKTSRKGSHVLDAFRMAVPWIGGFWRPTPFVRDRPNPPGLVLHPKYPRCEPPSIRTAIHEFSLFWRQITETLHYRSDRILARCSADVQQPVVPAWRVRVPRRCASCTKLISPFSLHRACRSRTAASGPGESQCIAP